MIRKLFGIFSLLFTRWTGLILYIAFTVISDSNNLESISFSLLPLIGPSLIPQSLTLFTTAFTDTSDRRDHLLAALIHLQIEQAAQERGTTSDELWRHLKGQVDARGLRL